MPTKTTSTTSRSLPGIWEGLENAFTLYKTILLRFLGLIVISFITVVVALLLGALGLGSLFALTGTASAQLGPVVSIIGGVILFGFFVGLLIISMIFAGAQISIMVHALQGKQLTIGESLEIGKQLWLKLLIASLVVGFLILGGYFALIIPGIVMSYLLLGTQYEVVQGKKGVLAAMKESTRVVGMYFWSFLGRFILLGIASMILNTTVSIALGDQAVLSFIISFLVSSFIAVYSISLYHDAKKAAGTKVGGSLTWMWIVSSIGWVVFLLLIAAIISFFMNNPEVLEEVGQSVTQELESEIQTETGAELEFDTMPLETVNPLYAE